MSHAGTRSFAEATRHLGNITLDEVEALSSASLDSFPGYMLLLRFSNGLVTPNMFFECQILHKYGYLSQNGSELSLYGSLVLGRVRALVHHA